MRIGLRPNKPNLGFAVRRDNGSIRARTSGLGLAKKDENAEEWMKTKGLVCNVNCC